MIGEFPPPQQPEPIRYVIEIDENGEITVRCGDRYQPSLCSDEALWLIARILMTDGNVKLWTKAEHDAQHARTFGPASILQPWQKLICAEPARILVGDVWRRTKPRPEFPCACGNGNPSTILHLTQIGQGIPRMDNYCDWCSPVVVL